MGVLFFTKGRNQQIMTKENIKQIITFLRSAEYIYQETYYNDYSNNPRPTYNFLIMLEGEANLTQNGKPFHIRKGEVVWIPKRSLYSVEWKGSPVLFSVLHFDFASAFDPFLYKQTHIQHLPVADIQALHDDFQFLKANDLSQGDYMSLSVFYRIFSICYPMILQHDSLAEIHVIQPAIDYIEEHYREKLEIKALAELCFISPSRFHHIFKSLVGVSPIAYKNTILIRHVQQTLLSDKSISVQTLADMYGFESTVYFCRLYKSVTGVTPTQSKKMNTLI